MFYSLLLKLVKVMFNKAKKIVDEKKESAKPVQPMTTANPLPAEERQDAEESDSDEEPASEEKAPAEENVETATEKKAESVNDLIEEAYRVGAGIDMETFNKAKAIINDFAAVVISGRFNPNVFRQALKLLDYDEAMKRSAAQEAASIPHLQGSKGIGGSRGKSIFDEARKAW